MSEISKDELCSGCVLEECPGPVFGEFTDDMVDILFVGEALGAMEVIKRRPFIGQTGMILRRTIKELGYTSYGITNIWKCRPPGNEVPTEELGEFCKQDLLKDLARCAKIVVPLGSTAVRAITGQDFSITQVQGRLFSSGGRIVLPMYHPSYLNRNGYYWRDWELAHTKLKDFLEGTRDYIPPDKKVVRQVVTPEDLKQWLITLASPEFPELDCDVETSAGYAPWAGAKIIAVSIAWDKYNSISFPWRTDVENWHVREAEDVPVMITPEIREMLDRMFKDPQKSWGWYNGQYDTQFFRAEGFEPRIDRDSMLEVHLVDERGSSDESTKGGVFHSLKRDSGQYTDTPDWEFDAKQYAPKKTDSYEMIPVDKLLNYNGLDTVNGKHLSSVLKRFMQEEETIDYYQHVVAPSFNMLSRARYVGIRVDLYRVRELQGRMKPVLEELEQKMIELSGNAFFNPNSPVQVKAALQARGLNVANTRKETLQAYEGEEFVDSMRAYRDCSKMLSTYVTGLAEAIYDDLRIHPDWRLPTETGRPRCGEPNVLGMPRKAEIEEHAWKRYIKEQFIADPGTIFMHLDRKQSEVRCMVFLADCFHFIETLIADPRSDIHGMFTKMLYGAGYTKEQRVLVKMIVFGLIYNRQAHSLATQFTAIERDKAHKAGLKKWKVWTDREAQKFIDDFFKLFPEMKVYKKITTDRALKEGVLKGYMGRVRRFGLVTWDNQKSIENQAVNFMPSNLSADLNFLSCIETVKQFGKYGVEVLVPIHDAGLLRVPKDSVYLQDEITAMWEALPEKELTRPGLPIANHNPKVPFPVDVSVGERWSDL